MNTTAKFLNSLNKEQKNRTSVHEALLSDRNNSYVLFRIKYFLLRNLLTIIFHALELFLILFFLNHNYAQLIIGIRVISFIVTGFWWGILENMRTDIRHLHQDDNNTSVGNQIAHWIIISALVALCFFITSASYILINLSPGVELSFFIYFYTTMILMQTGLRIITLTVHSGIYSIRRVYRPFFAVIASPLSGIITLLLLWPLTIEYCLPLATLIQTTSALAITLYYSLQMTRFSQIKITFNIQSDVLKKIIRTIISPPVLLIGLSSVFIHIEGLITFCFIYFGSSGLNLNNFIFYLLAPIIGASVMWTKIFYFDFKKNHQPWLINLNKRLEKSIIRSAFFISILLLLSARTLFFIFSLDWEPLYTLLLFLFIHSTCLLCTQQLICFSHNRHGLICISGVIALCGIVYCIISASSLSTALMLLSLIQYGMAFMIKHHKHRHKDTLEIKHPEPIPYYYWLEHIKQLSPKRLLHYQFDSNISYRAFKTGRFKLAQFHQTNNLTCSINKAVLLCAIYKHPSQYNNQYIYENLIHCPFIKTTTIGPLSTSQTIDKILSLTKTKQTNVHTEDELTQEFLQKFPNGVVIDLENNRSINTQSLKSSHWSSIYFGLIEFIEHPLLSRNKGAFHVSASYKQRIRVVYVIAKNDPNSRRSTQWSNQVHSFNLQQFRDNDSLSHEA